MSVTWTAGYAAASPYPMTHARILYTPASGTATASSEVEGFEASLALNPDTYSYWLPSLTPATWEVGFNAEFSPIAARRNLLTRSQSFDSATWVKAGVLPITSDTQSAPDGSITAEKIVPSADADFPHWVYQTSNVISGQPYTISCYFKSSGYNWVEFGITVAFAENYILFNTATGAIEYSLGVRNIKVVNAGGGWWRLSATLTATSSGLGYFVIAPRPANNLNVFFGDGTSGTLVWGAQLELGSTASIYQPVTSDYPTADTYVPNAVDAVGIAAHSLAGQSVAVDTWDGAAWVEQVPAFAVTDNGPLLMLFQEVTTSRVRLRVDGIPQPVGVIYAGKALVMPQKAYVGLGQINLKRRTEYKINQTEGGLWAGRSIARVSLIAAYQWTHLTDAFYLASVEPFSVSARQYPFFLAARPSGYPEETTYAWVAADIAPERMGVLDFCSVGFEAIGYSRA